MSSIKLVIQKDITGINNQIQLLSNSSISEFIW